MYRELPEREKFTDGGLSMTSPRRSNKPVKCNGVYGCSRVVRVGTCKLSYEPHCLKCCNRLSRGVTAKWKSTLTGAPRRG